MLQQKETIEDIRLVFAILQAYIKPGGSLNLTDINVHAEKFVCELLNCVYGWNLVNTNQNVPNYQCIDLIDPAVKLGIQVTSEGGAGKINQTIKCLSKHGMSKQIDKLKVFSLIPRQTSYTVNSTCPGIVFTWRTDVLDFDGTLKAITNITDSTQLQRVHLLAINAVPAVFATRRTKSQTSCEQLRSNLTVFDREVMWAMECHENPVLMCRAIRKMRITLQKCGASRIANSVASNNFGRARQVLSNIENEVKVKYPYIYQAAIQLPEGQSLPFGSYEKDDHSNSIHLIMGVRPLLKSLLQEVEDELERLENLLYAFV
ncbi:SMEK domain-containing protein [Phormidium tenue FACHB-886]|nr:SMEK domain-containing protein [Phormidium tenue FACHB-886]